MVGRGGEPIFLRRLLRGLMRVLGLQEGGEMCKWGGNGRTFRFFGRRCSVDITLQLVLLVLVVVAVDAQQLPIAAIGRIVLLVVVLVMDRQLFQPLAGKLAAATGADMRE